ncbi:MAG: sugar phosphate isomerase/epimerase family protein [Actinomycetota bacterium]
MIGRLGLSSHAYYWACQGVGGRRLTAWDLLRTTREFELDALQLCENVDLSGWSPDDLERYGRAAEESDVSLELGTRGLDRAVLRQALSAAGALGAGVVRIVAWSGEEDRRGGVTGELRSVIDELLPEARAHGIALAIENYFSIDDAELADLVSGYDDEYLGVCLDTANSVGLLHAPDETTRLLAPYAVSVHLKDFTVRKLPIGYRVTGAPLGQGWLDVSGVLAELDRCGRRPSLLLELWVDPEDDPNATIEKEADWVQTSVGFLRSHLGERRQTAGAARH